MHDEPDIFEVLAGTSDAAPRTSAGADASRLSDDAAPEEALIDLSIERDLAVMLVGSDAGRRERIKPHNAMTRGASAQEEADARVLMTPFLEGEIRRVRGDKAHRSKISGVKATTRQALALKGFRIRYAEFPRSHLENHPNDDRSHRGRQRLARTYRVIDQINTALGTHFDDGQTLGHCRREVIVLTENLASALEALESRARASGADDLIEDFSDLQTAARSFLSLPTGLIDNRSGRMRGFHPHPASGLGPPGRITSGGGEISPSSLHQAIAIPVWPAARIWVADHSDRRRGFWPGGRLRSSPFRRIGSSRAERDGTAILPLP